MALQGSDFWTWRGTVGRTKYFALGVTLFAAKHLLDRIVATRVFGLRWSLFNYWLVSEATEIDDTPPGHLRFYATLVALAIPFIWVGVVLTLRRLRDIGWPLWLVAAFFLPFVNLLFFLLLSTVPSRERSPRARTAPGLRAALDRVVPRSSFGSAVVGVVATTLVTVGVTALSVQGLGNYGWGLFVGLPFCLGLSSVLVYGYRQPRPLGQCLLVSLLSVGLASAALIAVAIEGLICVLMAAPLGAVMALFGGAMGYIIQRRPERDSSGNYALHAFSVTVLALPVLMFMERAAQLEPPLREVRTRVEIHATREEVWQHLVAFAELPPPQEWLFQTGIAYPIRAEIDGRGVGAVRQCVFSTGAFVEPIEVWDEPQLLKFGVTAQPPVMEELSPYTHLRPPHLNHYLQSRKGQFLLTRLPDGKTLLEGTTWYRNSFWPGAYWNLWSDYIIHRIHQRVLNHIRRLAEQRREAEGFGYMPPNKSPNRTAR
jgi:uncharacterized membrane protein YhaH (DUF805 family)